MKALLVRNCHLSWRGKHSLHGWTVVVVVLGSLFESWALGQTGSSSDVQPHRLTVPHTGHACMQHWAPTGGSPITTHPGATSTPTGTKDAARLLLFYICSPLSGDGDLDLLLARSGCLDPVAGNKLSKENHTSGKNIRSNISTQSHQQAWKTGAGRRNSKP